MGRKVARKRSKQQTSEVTNHVADLSLNFGKGCMLWHVCGFVSHGMP